MSHQAPRVAVVPYFPTFKMTASIVKPLIDFLSLTGAEFCFFCREKQSETLSTREPNREEGETSCTLYRPFMLYISTLPVLEKNAKCERTKSLNRGITFSPEGSQQHTNELKERLCALSKFRFRNILCPQKPTIGDGNTRLLFFSFKH